MKALVKFGPGVEGMAVRDIPEPIPAENELKVKILAGGICGTDVHIMKDEYSYNAPVVMGHEYVGIVDEVGSDVKDFKKGDYIVSLTAAKTCGHCRYCSSGMLMLCSERLSIGSGMNGAFAEYMTIPANLAFKVPKEVKNKEDLAICEPLACVVRGVIERSTVKAGDIVLVSGPGAIGLLTVQLAKIQGAYVIASGTPLDKSRLELALELGADRIATSPEELKGIIEELDPDGVDVAFECAGAAASAKQCVLSLRKQGIYSQVGLFGKEISINMDEFLFKELQITNNFASERTSWETALRLVKNGQVDLGSIISARVPLENWQEGFDIFMSKKGYKVVLVP
ncbi:MAG TPA: alcohol dehydrogenase catalytic domain-containing protein [Clostridia bacterium]|nr:alcohol dehydrogenase catalytic domain-containing protein [Clostridia bacterium]